ncbi:MAG: cytochrome c1 [Akkermansiaceae bacterium]|nr:cytochrome c1 [Akkermansiaceae bacterium]
MQTCISWFLAAAAGCLLVSCAGGGGSGDLGGADPPEGGISEVPNPNAAMAAKSGKALGQLQRGHEVYMLKCAECHNYKLPHQIDVPRWQAGRLKSDCGASLAGGDPQAVVDYVTAVKSQ